ALAIQFATYNPTELGQRLAQRGPNRLEPRIAVIIGIQPTEQWHAPVRLRARRERPRRRAAEQRDERAASHHSITSSARASTVVGISRPSAFAVLRLTTNSYFVGACT